jgi:hypothetical protein
LSVVSRKTVYVLLIALLMLSIAVRYPLVEHERNQTDSYFIHDISKSIVTNGYAVWVFHPLSYFGLYPFSYPSGVPFLLAEVSSLTGLGMELSILLMNFLTAIIFALGVFVLARQFLAKPEYVLLATFFAVLGSRFVDTTYWDGSARGPIVVLSTLAVYASLRASKTHQTWLLVLALLFGVGSFATHHMAILLVLFGIGYVLAAFQIQYVLPRVGRHKLKVAIVWNLAIGTAIGIVVFGYFDFYNSMGFVGLEKTSVFDFEPPVLSMIVNLAASYTNQIGFVLVFAILGIPILVCKSSLRVEMLFPVALLLAFIPMLGNTLYVSMILAPFISILGVAVISRLFRQSKRKRLVAFAVVALMTSSLVLPMWSTQRWNEREYLSGETIEVSNQVFSDASYLTNSYQSAPAISNVWVMAAQLGAVSQTIFLGSGISLVLSGDIRNEDIQRNITLSRSEFPRNLYDWFEMQEPQNVNWYVQRMMILGIGSIKGSDAAPYFLKHSNLVVAVDNSCPNQFVNPYGLSKANFLSELENSVSYPGKLEFQSYKTYQTQGLSLYIIKLPS